MWSRFFPLGSSCLSVKRVVSREVDSGEAQVQRLSVRYSGRVQGVGFRATVDDLARNFQVTGRVSNVLDGSVDLQADGEEPELIAFQRAIQQRLQRNIVDSQEHWRSIDRGEWSSFGVGPDLLR
jgi:acylphosphatase